MKKITSSGRIIAQNTTFQEKLLLKAFPGSKKGNDIDHWEFSLNPADRKRVVELAEKLDFDIDPELCHYKVSEQAEKAKKIGLYDYQAEGVNYLSFKEAALLGDDMGLGKSVQAICALPDGCSAIIVSPACVKFNWEDEINKWAPHFKIKIISGRGNFVWPEAGEIVIINFDILPEYMEPKRKGYKEFLRLPLGLAAKARTTRLIVDECHLVRNGKTKRARRVRGLARICHSVWGLSGTPLLNKPGDLWGMLYNLGMAKEVFGTFDNFKFLFNGYKNKWGGLEYKMPPNPVAPELLKKVMLRRLRYDVLPELPRKTYNTVKVDRIPKDLLKELDEAFGKWGPLLLIDEMPDFSQFSGIRRALAASRIPAMIEYVELCEEQDVPILVFSAHREPILELAKREGWEIILGDTPPKKRRDIVKKFQDGKLKGVGLSIQAGGVGLTLTRAWKALFIDLDWVPANNSQAEDRICRLGQTSDKVEIVRMVTDHPLDLHIMKLIAKKINMFNLAIEKEFSIKKAYSSGDLSEEEQGHRLAEIQKIIQNEDEKGALSQSIKTKVASLGRHLEKVVNGRKKLRFLFKKEYTPEIKNMFPSLINPKEKENRVFDLAHFNMAKFIYFDDLESEEAVEAAYYLLTVYAKRLKNMCPSLFKKVKQS